MSTASSPGDADVQRGEDQQREHEQRARRRPPRAKAAMARAPRAGTLDAGHGDDRQRERGVHGEPGHGGQERRGRQDGRPRVGDAQRRLPRSPRQDDREPLGHRERGARRDVDCCVSVEESRHRRTASRVTRAGGPPKAHVRARVPTFRGRRVPRRHAGQTGVCPLVGRERQENDWARSPGTQEARRPRHGGSPGIRSARPARRAHAGAGSPSGSSPRAQATAGAPAALYVGDLDGRTLRRVTGGRGLPEELESAQLIGPEILVRPGRRAARPGRCRRGPSRSR